VVLDRDLTVIPPHDILGTQVIATVVGGRTVYQHPGVVVGTGKFPPNR